MLLPENCYLHIIDPQDRLMRQIHDADKVTATIAKIIHCAKIIDIPIIGNTQYKQGLGAYVPELEKLMVDVSRPDKTVFNALANRETKKLITALPASVTTAILVGVETHICIYQTAAGLQEIGVTPWVVADAVSSRTEVNHTLGLERMRDMDVVIGPAEMILYELLGKSGTPEFKEVLPHIL